MSITLFKKDSKGRVRKWHGFIDGDEVVTFTGLVNGKLKEERRRAKTKNEGKANETTGHEQAQLELESKARKERDKGYFNTIEEAKTNVVILPMLAHSFDKRSKHIIYPAVTQPKLDGVRAMVQLDAGHVSMFTRRGKPFPMMPKLISSLIQLGDKVEEVLGETGVYIDGELFSPDIPFEELSGHCRRMNHEEKGTTPLLDLIRLNVFDCYVPSNPGASFIERYRIVKKLIGFRDGMIQLVVNTPVFNEADVKTNHDQYVQGGFEGTIVRNRDGMYKLNGRSNDLLKYKDFLDDEFLIVDYEEGQGRDEGTVIWVCVTPEGKKFNVRPRGTHKQRSKWYDHAGDYIYDKELTVRYQELTQDGIPRFPVGIGIRDYE